MSLSTASAVLSTSLPLFGIPPRPSKRLGRLLDAHQSYVFVTNDKASGSNGVSTYRTGTIGALTSIGTYSAGPGASDLAVLPNGGLLYVMNDAGSTISAYVIGGCGARMRAWRRVMKEPVAAANDKRSDGAFDGKSQY